MRWELNDLARRLDEQPAAVGAARGAGAGRRPAATPASRPDGRRMLEAIDGLPEDEREVFDLVRIQGLTQAEAAEVLGRLGQDGAAAAEPRPAAAGGAAGRPPPGRAQPDGPPPESPGEATAPRRPAMADDPRVSDCSRRCSTRAARPEEVCRDCPELLPEVRERLAAAAAASRPSSTRCSPTPAPRRRRGRPRPGRRRAAARSPATRWRRCWAAAAWASSTGPGTCASTAPSP